MARKKRRRRIKYQDINLNIMPFIDVFSLLNTFLLMSAVFLAIGVIEVQIPFLSPVTKPPDDDDRSLEVKVDMTKEGIEVTTSWSRPPYDEVVKTFKNTPEDLAALHKHLVEVRRRNPETDKVQFFSDDDVIWKDIARVLDTIKLRQPGDPTFQTKTDSDVERALAAEFLFPKVVMASVML